MTDAPIRWLPTMSRKRLRLGPGQKPLLPVVPPLPSSVPVPLRQMP